jgi:hypothetical protein
MTLSRNIAFLITTNNSESIAFIKAKAHLLDLSEKFEYKLFSIKVGIFKLIISFAGQVTFTNENGFFRFPIGNYGNKPINYDRFLDISIAEDSIKITNDYAGCIPVYYSLRNYLTISNIELCTVLDSNTSIDDLAYENIYGFIRYSHFIWDETAFKHICMMEPDSEFNFNGRILKLKSSYLKTVTSSDINTHLNDRQMANELDEINDKLVCRALESYNKIILPLSSGYDSRMILAALSKNSNLKERVSCFTYGGVGSVEVEAARRLAKVTGINWMPIELPLNFLSTHYLLDVHNIIGSSLHMHGMYQLEFVGEIAKFVSLSGNTCLTSGFMTGPQAGQHTGLMGKGKHGESISKAMSSFSQSQYWFDREISFASKDYFDKAEERFQLAFNRFDGEIYQKLVMLDVWSRQRNFISYYPRVLEWGLPTVSPHMCPEFANFFMSISQRHLDNRLAVELMFAAHYPQLAAIVSNSNGLKSINNKIENSMFMLSRLLRKLKLNNILSKTFSNRPYEFNCPSLRNAGTEGVYPLFSDNYDVNAFLNKVLLPEESVSSLYQSAVLGDVRAYSKMTSLQSIAMTIIKITS